MRSSSIHNNSGRLRMSARPNQPLVNVALPAIVRELHASTTQLEWIVDAYNLMFAASILAAGNLGDRIGRKGVLLSGLVVFGAASLPGGLGTSTGELIAARAVMGLGAELIFPATLSLLTNVFTERGERARAIGLWGASTGVGVIPAQPPDECAQALAAGVGPQMPQEPVREAAVGGAR